jgi:hypothetical protein
MFNQSHAVVNVRAHAYVLPSTQVGCESSFSNLLHCPFGFVNRGAYIMHAPCLSYSWLFIGQQNKEHPSQLKI